MSSSSWCASETNECILQSYLSRLSCQHCIACGKGWMRVETTNRQWERLVGSLGRVPVIIIIRGEGNWHDCDERSQQTASGDFRNPKYGVVKVDSGCQCETMNAAVMCSECYCAEIECICVASFGNSTCPDFHQDPTSVFVMLFPGNCRRELRYHSNVEVCNSTSAWPWEAFVT